MKFHSIFIILLLLSLILSPLAAVGQQEPGDESPSTSAPSGETESSAQEKKDPLPDGETVKVFLSASKKVKELSLREYLLGTVASEMNAGFHEQALMAQAVASYSFLRREQLNEQKEPSKTLQGADISDQSELHQGYKDSAARKAKWGEKQASYEKKIGDAIDAVWGYLLTYKDEPIYAVYHAISPGKTESAQAVWGKDLPYLQSVLSVGDKLSPNYSKTLALSEAQFREKAEELENVKLGAKPESWLGKSSQTVAGTVASIEIGGQEYSGTAVRKAFGLSSAAFSVLYKDGSFQFQTKGYGHAVGMSQYGADYMARQGSNWQEILRYYYSGVTIEKQKI